MLLSQTRMQRGNSVSSESREGSDVVQVELVHFLVPFRVHLMEKKWLELEDLITAAHLLKLTNGGMVLHMHMRVLFLYTSHILPSLKWWFWQSFLTTTSSLAFSAPSSNSILTGMGYLSHLSHYFFHHLCLIRQVFLRWDAKSLQTRERRARPSWYREPSVAGREQAE